MPTTKKSKAEKAKILWDTFQAHKKKTEKEATKIPRLVGPPPPKDVGRGGATTSAQKDANRRAAARKAQSKKGKGKKDKHGSLGEESFASKKKDGEGGPSLAKTLTTIAASTKPGRGKIGAAISGGLSGAAIGATIGEASDARKRRAAVEARRKKKKNGEDGS